jgi:hypothetical protein
LDFIKFLRSLEEFLYEVASWLIFYPRTMWMSVVHPLQMMEYTLNEQTVSDERKYSNLMSPPLFLMLSILIAHGLELAARAPRTYHSPLMASIMKSDENLLILRSVVFSVYPLSYAQTILARLKIPLDRDTLRAPFFSQCYVAAPFAMVLGLGSVGMRLPDAPSTLGGAAAVLLAIGWYLWLQTLWLAAHASLSRWRSVALAVWAFTKATLVVTAVTLIMG